jgi:hypothetical protein
MNKVKQIGVGNLAKEAQKVLESVLSGIPFVEIRQIKSNIPPYGPEADFIVETVIAGKPSTLVVEVKSRGEPRITRMAAAHLRSLLRGCADCYGIFMAPYLSDASRQICKEEGTGCIDLAGNAFLSFRNIFIDISGRPNPFADTRAAKSVFSPKSSRVLRVLLAEPDRRWFVEDMSQEAGISIGLVSKVKRALLDREWIREENRKFYLTRPEEVLNEWAENYSYTKNERFSFYSGLSAEQIEEAIRRECERRKWRYGLALLSGARKVAPFVRSMRFFAYIDGDIEDIANALQFRKVVSGPNVTLLQPYDEGVFYGMQEINGIAVVSDIQLYLDLKTYRGRGEEAAQAILEQRIRPKW